MKTVGMDAALSGYEAGVGTLLGELEDAGFSARLWRKDPTLWKTEPEHGEIILNSMGWLDSPGKISAELQSLVDFSAELKKAGIRHVVHMGMGGSSLAPLVFKKTFTAEGLSVTVLDSTDPATILALERSLRLEETLFIEASKSGSTIESRSFGEYFYAKVLSLKGKAAGENFAVITDPGSMLAKLAEERSYRKIFLNYPDIGGRYSALSYFGLVPAGLMGIDLNELLARARTLAEQCGAATPASRNPGAVLGAIMGSLALKGRNKLTFLMPDQIASFGMWLEQLIAESTGKDGAGIVPVAGEPPCEPEIYSDDRLFVEFKIVNERDPELEAHAQSLRAAGQPVVTILMRDRLDLGAQFLLWEIATATAGVALKINPFDQPNVQATKQFTATILDEVRKEGRVPEAPMEMADGPLRLYAAGGASTVRQAVQLFFEQADSSDYLVLLAYLTENEGAEHGLQSIRSLVRERLHIATTIGYGPRYLHSTGQLHKGGPNSGLFVILTSESGEDALIPDQPYSFGMLMRAQALGDFEALRKHRRRVIRVHLAGEVPGSLAAFEEVIRVAVRPV